MPGPWRSYTEAERAEAVGVALTIGTKKAAVQLGIPRRTLSSWLQRPTAEVQAAIVRTHDDVAARLWEAVTAGTDAVLAGLRDPKARLGEKATALRIVVEAHALITGQATSRTETTTLDTGPQLTDAERRAFVDFYDSLANASDDELDAWLRDGGLRSIRDGVTGGTPDVG